MELTLKQLTPENLQLLFEQGFFNVVKMVPNEMEEENKDEIKYWGYIMIKDDGSHWRIQPTDNEFIQFSYSYWTRAENAEPKDILLKVSNVFDTFPVHCHYSHKDDEGNVCMKMIYNQIFPEDGSVEAKKLVRIFKTFQKMTINNMKYLNQVIEMVKEGDDD